MNRNFGGPIQNEFVGLLHKHSKSFEFEFVDCVSDCDIIFTNDVYPETILNVNKPKVKRMDGVFWQEEFKERNIKYNLAAQQSDLVIFISEYSKNSYFKLYGNDLRNNIVVTHWTEKKSDYCNDRGFNRIFFSMATDWNRKEKRLNEVIKFAEIFPEDRILLIGKCETVLPKNIIRLGYLDSNYRNFKNVMKVPTAFLNLTCKDAATKTVCDALNFHIPVLYSNSGGVNELVKDCGIKIYEHDEIEFLDTIPELNEADIRNGYNEFVYSYDTLINNIEKRMTKDLLKESLSEYFNNIRKVIKC
jgi:hypothetical protein